MKTAAIIAFIILQGVLPKSYAHVYLDYPYGGETFMAHTIINIEWHIAIPHEQLNWDLFFSVDGGETWQPIQYDLPVSQLSYSWVVPSIATSQARISIIQDNVDMDYQDESMDFTILPEPNTPFIDITAQNLNLNCDVTNQEAAIAQWLEDHGGAVAVGFCGELVWTHDYYDLTNECGATGNAYVTFTAADECGSASTSAYLNVYDLQAPVIEVHANNIMVECNPGSNEMQLQNWLDNHAYAVATDACGDVTWSNNFTILNDSCGLAGFTSVTFFATDECGNSSATSATFSIADQTPPALLMPALDKVVPCTDTTAEEQLLQWLQDNGGATAVDACGSITWHNDYMFLNTGCGSTKNTTVTFTATDECGQSTSTTAMFSINDTIAPVIAMNARDTTIDCSQEGATLDLRQWLDNHGGAIAHDLCGDVSWSHNFPQLPDTCGMTRTLPITFHVSDACGNQNSTSAVVTLLATTSVSHEVPEFMFQLFPNPADDLVFVTLDKFVKLPVRLVLIDAFGKSIISLLENNHAFSIRVSELSSGIYFCRISNSEAISVEQIVIR